MPSILFWQANTVDQESHTKSETSSQIMLKVLGHAKGGHWLSTYLTTEIYQVSVEERLSVEFFYVQYSWPLKATSQSFLGTTFVSNEGL